TLRTTEVDQANNNEALGINLDLIEERREQAAEQASNRAKWSTAAMKQVMPRTEVNFGPKWEGPYEVKESLGKGAYKLKDRKGNDVPRTWN
ncbi:hypothetical protein Tco_0473498, partial [Tanacetum coccineum]